MHQGQQGAISRSSTRCWLAWRLRDKVRAASNAGLGSSPWTRKGRKLLARDYQPSCIHIVQALALRGAGTARSAGAAGYGLGSRQPEEPPLPYRLPSSWFWGRQLEAWTPCQTYPDQVLKSPWNRRHGIFLTAICQGCKKGRPRCWVYPLLVWRLHRRVAKQALWPLVTRPSSRRCQQLLQHMEGQLQPIYRATCCSGSGTRKSRCCSSTCRRCRRRHSGTIGYRVANANLHCGTTANPWFGISKHCDMQSNTWPRCIMNYKRSTWMYRLNALQGILLKNDIIKSFTLHVFTAWAKLAILWHQNQLHLCFWICSPLKIPIACDSHFGRCTLI